MGNFKYSIFIVHSFSYNIYKYLKDVTKKLKPLTSVAFFVTRMILRQLIIDATNNLKFDLSINLNNFCFNNNTCLIYCLI